MRSMKIILLSSLCFVFVSQHVIADGTNRDWEVVRSVPNPFGGTNDYVLIPPDKVRDLTNYHAAAEAVAGTRDRCAIYFWTNREDIPTSAWMAVTNMQTLTATYERYPTYKAPVFRLASWLYPSAGAASRANAFVLPGAKTPKAEAATNKPPDAIRKP
jgi:hypothetical protein